MEGYHSGSNDVGSFFAMCRNKKDPGIRQRCKIIIQSLVELYEFYHESVIGTGDSPLLLDKLLSFLVVKPKFKDDVGDDEGN